MKFSWDIIFANSRIFHQSAKIKSCEKKRQPKKPSAKIYFFHLHYWIFNKIGCKQCNENDLPYFLDNSDTNSIESLLFLRKMCFLNQHCKGDCGNFFHTINMAIVRFLKLGHLQGHRTVQHRTWNPRKIIPRSKFAKICSGEIRKIQNPRNYTPAKFFLPRWNVVVCLTCEGVSWLNKHRVMNFRTNSTPDS